MSVIASLPRVEPKEGVRMATTVAKAAQPLGAEELRKIDAYWRASNYLSVGQIYLYDNPLLKEPLRKEHVKPRLLGHWGTTPALADDHPADAEGLDGSEGGGRAAGRGYVSLPPGAALRAWGEAGASGAARAVAEELPAGGVVR